MLLEETVVTTRVTSLQPMNLLVTLSLLDSVLADGMEAVAAEDSRQKRGKRMRIWSHL